MDTSNSEMPSEGQEKTSMSIFGGDQDLNILVTEEDKHGMDISKMSNFFDGYVAQLSYSLREKGKLEVVPSVPLAELGILNDLVHHASAVMKAGVSFLPDFESLPTDIKRKLKKGIYTLGQSRQVNGNVRAVILDENGVRIKDVTLKRVVNDPGTLATERSIANQLQMRQLSAKLDSILALQSYQLDRDRDTSILSPFFEARRYILNAQSQDGIERRTEHLKLAAQKLTEAVANVILEMRTDIRHLVKATRRPIFQQRSMINRLMHEIAEDIQLATKFTGLQVQVYERLGDTGSAHVAMEQYQSFLKGFFCDPVTSDGLPAADLIHMNYPYSAKNLDGWHKLKEEMRPLWLPSQKEDEQGNTFLVSIEDITDE